MREQQNRLEEQLQMIGGLANEYYALYYINLGANTLSIYSMDGKCSPKVEHMVAEGGHPMDVLLRFGTSELVHPDDRRLFKELGSVPIETRLAHSKKFSVRFRRLFNEGEYRWCEMDVIKYEATDQPANAIAVGFADRDESIRSEMVLSQSFYIMNSALSPDESINELLAIAGEYYGAERAYIFEYGIRKVTVNNTYEWCAKGIEAMKDKLQDVPSETIEGWIREFQRQGAFFMDALDTEHNTPETIALLEMQGISSLVAAPIMVSGQIAGFIGVDNPTKAKTHIEALKTIATVSYSEILNRNEFNGQNAFNSFFLEPYLSAYYIGLDDNSCQIYKRTAYLEKEYSKGDSYLADIDAYIAHDVHPDDREKLTAAVNAENIRTELAKQDHYSVTYRDISQGQEHTYRLHIIRGADEKHAALGFIDISEEVKEQKKQAEEQETRRRQLEEALSMAQSANRAKTTFLNNMSHDIRTPMNAIIGYTGLAASHIDNKTQVQDYLSKIAMSSDHLLSLINDVLDMSRIESGKIFIDEKPESLPDIIHTLRDIVQADIRAKQQDFFIDTVNVKNEQIICDKLRLNQVLLNILSNAIKYTAPGGTVAMRITEKTINPSGHATYEFHVKDNGIGMNPEFLKTIFDPFSRVNSSTVSGIQGTGLGMAIAKNIVDLMGGTIKVLSELGKGTEVIVTFQFKLSDRSMETIDLARFKGLRGLIVDDDADTCMSVAKMFRDIGIRSLWCTSGKEAVLRARDAFLSNDLYKLYIIDWLMPDMNGIETVRRIRKEIGDDAPIIILTAYDWSDIEKEAREAGVTAFIHKPIFPSDLHRTLNNCFNSEQQVSDDSKPEEPELNDRKILLVEDNDLNREIATTLLEEFGAVVTTAEDGDIAVEKMKEAQAGDYDIILMDIQMPTMNGYEATRHIRALGTEISKIPILAMTANAFEEDRKAALEAGMNEHIVKPIDIEKLKAVLTKFLLP